MTLRILSKRFSPLEMEKEASAFFAGQQAAFAAITDADVTEKAQSIIKSLEDPPTQYSEEASQFWDAIVTDMPLQWTEMVIEELRTLSLADVTRAANEWLFDSCKRRSLSVMLFGNTHLQDLEKYKASNDLTGEFFSLPQDRIFSKEDLLRFKDSLPFSKSSN